MDSIGTPNTGSIVMAAVMPGRCAAQPAPATITLMAAGILVEVLLGLTLGIIAALDRGGPTDRLVMASAFVGVSAPQFVVALLLLYLFAATLGWFPMSGYGSFSNIVLPAATLGLLGAGWYARMVRSAMIDVLNQSTGINSATRDKWPRAVLQRTFDFGFAAALSHKDMKLMVAEAEALGMEPHLGIYVRDLLARVLSEVGPDADFTAMAKVVEADAGLDPERGV